MSLDTIMSMSITVESKAPSQAGFGTPLLFGYHTAWLDVRVKLYATADEMLDDGFTADDDLYKAARIVKSQNPSPDVFMVGRRVVPLTQTVVLTPLNTTQGFKYKGVVGGKDVTYTVGSSATTTTVATGLAAAINAVSPGTTAVAASGVITCTSATPGKVIDFDFSTMKRTYLQVKDTTTDTTTDDELPLINDENDDWYGLMIVDSSSKATALNAAAFIESKRKICIVQTSDTEVLNPSITDDTMSALKDSSYARTGAIFHLPIGGVEWLAAGWEAGQLTTTPGAATTAFKGVAGVKVDKLLAGEEAAILAKNGSHYTRVGGLPITFEGKSGAGDFLDTTRFIDWVYARMRERVLGALANNQKIPFTDAGVDIIRGLIMSVIQQGIAAGGFADTPAPTVTAPLVRDVSPANRINRILPDVNWTAQLAGAIHRLNPVRGTVSV